MPTTHQKIALRVPAGSWKGRYSTYVEEIGGEGFTVAHPMYGGGLVPLMPGDEVVVEYIERDERLAFSTTVLGRETKEVAILVLSLPEEGAVQRHQLRDFVRLDVSLPLGYLPIQVELPQSSSTPTPPAMAAPPEAAQANVARVQGAQAKAAPTKAASPEGAPAGGTRPGGSPAEASQSEPDPAVAPPEPFEGRTMNLSGSGAQIVTHECYPLGTRLDLILHLPKQTVIAEAEVVRLAGEVSTGEAWLGVRFTAIHERDRERIVRYIFSEQRNRRRIGLL